MGYVSKKGEELTKELSFCEGDCGYMDEQGLVFILERLKELIKCMDNQVTPAELEDYISAHRDDIRLEYSCGWILEL